MEKLPPEIILHITPHLGAFDLYHLLIAYHCPGLYHNLRPRVFDSHQDGSIALYHAIRMGRLDLIKEIPNIHQLITAIDKFTRYGQLDEGCYFAGKEREFAASNCGGYINPLIVAIIQRQVYPTDDLEIIRFLLEAGADPDAPDLFHRQLPLFVAANSDDHEAVSLLLDFGADPNKCSYEGSLLLHDGSLSENPTIKQWKIRSPLDAAVRGGHLQIVKLLIQKGDGVLASCPFNLLDLKTRKPSPELMEIFQNLHECAVYRMKQSQIFRLFEWTNPSVNMKRRQSARIARIEKRTKTKRHSVNQKFQEQFNEFLSLFTRQPVQLAHQTRQITYPPQMTPYQGTSTGPAP